MKQFKSCSNTSGLIHPLKQLDDKKYYKPIAHFIGHDTYVVSTGAIIQHGMKLITRDDLVQIHLYKASYV